MPHMRPRTQKAKKRRLRKRELKLIQKRGTRGLPRQALKALK